MQNQQAVEQGTAATAATGDTRIFVSYRRADASKAATKIYAKLAKHFGGKEQVFQDVSSIRPGIPWDEAIDDAVGSCHVFLVVIGNRWLTATDAEHGNRRLEDPHDRHRREIEVALDRRIPVLPVLIDEATMPRPEDLPGEKLKKLERIQAQRLDMYAFDADVEDLIEVVERAAALQTAPAEPPVTPPVEEPEPPGPVADEEEAKRREVGVLLERGAFAQALEVAASIEDPVLRADLVLAIAKMQAEAGASQREAQDALGQARDATVEISDAGERDRVLAETASVEEEIVEALPPDDQRLLAEERGDFAAAQQLTGTSGTVYGDNSTATKEPGEPEHAGNPGGRSVWFRWVAPTSGTATVDTVGSDFDTLLAVYLGSSVTDLSLVAENDDAEGVQSRVTFRASEGAEYRIAVDGYSGAAGALVLNWEVEAPPANDHFDDALELVAASGTIHGNSVGASKEPGEPDHAGSGGGSSVWYRWTAPHDGVAVVDTFGSDFDTLLAVYRGSSLDWLDRVAANDDHTGRQSRVAFRAGAGEEYRIAVDGYAGSAGTLVLNWVVVDRESLPLLLDQAGLRYQDVGGGAVVMRFPGDRADQLAVDAKEDGELVFFSVDIPGYSGWGERGVLERLLKLSYGVDYVKAMSLPSGGFALAAEIPASALTQVVCEGLTWSLVALGDVSGPADLANEIAWNERVLSAKAMQDRFLFVDQATAEADVRRMLEGAGLLGAGTYVLNLGPETRPLSVHVSQRVISLMVTLEGVRTRDKQKLRRLLDVNRRVDVAKVGFDPSGNVTLLYEVPAVVPELPEHAIVQLRELYAAVRAAI